MGVVGVFSAWRRPTAKHQPLTARRHHYVWRKYLEPWAVATKKSRQIWCLRRDKAFPIPVDTTKVAAERDFYRLDHLDRTDAQFIRAVAFRDDTTPKLRELNENWIGMFEAFFALHRLTQERVGHDPAAHLELKKSLIEFQENAYQRMENDCLPMLTALQAGDTSFFKDDTHATPFCWFLVHQYFRTKAMRDRMREQFKDPEQLARFDRTWPILRHVFATNVAFSIFIERHSTPLQVLRAAPDMEFITSDQPVVNTYGAFTDRESLVDELELFYPVSPTRAAILSGHSVYRGADGNVLDPFRMTYLNQTMERTAHEQLLPGPRTLSMLLFRRSARTAVPDGHVRALSYLERSLGRGIFP